MEHKELMIALAALLTDAANDAHPARLAAAMRTLADRLTGPKQATLPEIGAPTSAPPKPDTQNEVVDQVRLVFEYWRSRTGHWQARLLPERAQHIRARLRDFSPAELCDAVDGCLLSDFHTGTNDRAERYDWIENIMRNGSAVEKHAARARSAKGAGGALGDGNPETARLRAELDRAMEAGDVRGANEINKRLAAALRGAAAGGRRPGGGSP